MERVSGSMEVLKVNYWTDNNILIKNKEVHNKCIDID